MRAVTLTAPDGQASDHQPVNTATSLLPTLAGPESWPIERLWDAGPMTAALPIRGGTLPADLQARFDAPLEIPLRRDRPTVIVNFVSTLDGVVALDRVGASGGREISGGFEPDRFVMGLLRASADAVLVGAGTVRASGTRAWTPSRVHRPSADAYAGWRRDIGLATSTPATVVVTASGDLRPADFDMTDPELSVILVSTTAGARRMRALPCPERVEIVDLGDRKTVPVDSVLGFLRDRGFDVVLSEGGPTLFGELLAAIAVDDLFLTVAPQVAGRSEQTQRLSLVERTAFSPSVAPWARLRSVMRSDDYLFLRYDLSARNREGVS
jgi:riboflavin biosynthesis pyrimidine reductase